ncbi:MAG: CapA family protein [Bacteroidales bacterium]|nr:CapA family protein [Bacteroidales bacterium]
MKHLIGIILAFTLLSAPVAFSQNFDWLRPLPAVFFKPDTVSVYVIGDIMSHGQQIKSAFRNGSADYSTFLLHLSSRIQKADVAIGNMEFPLGGKPYSGYPAFSAPDEYAKYLSDLGFDVLLTANNHILDKGSDGLTRTLDQLDSLPVLHTGCARADTLLTPLIIKTKGVSIGIVNFTYGTNLGPTKKEPVVARQRKEEVKRLMDACRGADFVFVFPHWDLEYKHTHSAKTEEWARWLVSEGANLIIGTHPHVVQDCSLIEGTPVFYSIGNAVSNQNQLPTRLELGLRIRIIRPFGEAPRLLDVQAEYLWCTKPDMLEDSYATIPVKDFMEHPELWKQPGDYNDMLSTYQAVQTATSIPDGYCITLESE